MKFKLEESQIAIRPTVDEGAIVDLSFIIIGITNTDKNIQQATVYATSETNSYGILIEKHICHLPPRPIWPLSGL